MAKNILFLGGTGNISRAVSRRVLAEGHRLTLLNRGRRNHDLPEGARFVKADLNRPEDVAEALGKERFDAIVDWIAFTPGDIDRDYALFHDRTDHYVFISSASVYQKPPTQALITESTPRANPFWDYSHQKILAEERLEQLVRETGFPATILRPSLTYDTVIPAAFAAWDDFTLIARLRAGREVVIHGDGTSLWTVTHAEDFARGFVPLLGHPQAIGHAFHITSDEVLTWNQIYTAIAHAAGIDTPRWVHLPSDFIVQVEPGLRGTLHGDKMWSAIFDNSKIRRIVPDFRATIPFHEGIRRTVAWFEARPERQRIVAEHDAIHDRLLAAWHARSG